jgi:hypothetical protein
MVKISFNIFDWKSMQDNERCCGTGTCIIDEEGVCWCGQVWDGKKMCRPDQLPLEPDADDSLGAA